ncbi:MAG: sigma-54-dependent Fis family transcriptional regulator [Desulfovibrionaceae bacterium]|nr:sigma-54-dependent Fis family transcriptional regulator [Desulfovibrionaceae bacterium]
MAKVLVIDDDRPTCEILTELVRHIGHEADYALSIGESRRRTAQADYDVVFLDISLPDGNGLDILPQLRELPSAPEVIILTGFGDPDGAELAIRNGAWDYLQKPVYPQKVLLPLERVLKYRDHLNNADQTVTIDRCGIIGHSGPIRHALKRLGMATRIDASLLLNGETGTGKELFAHALHKNSKRRNGPFVVVDCASIPSNLLESTLFGHVKGAFTGADHASGGLILSADGGTLFLDEIGEMPLPLQKKLLRVLQERTYRPVGGSREVSSDFRLVAATHRDLHEMVQDGTFRHDLLYRLGAMTIALPPLRERKEDIEELAHHFVGRICRKNNVPPKAIPPDFIEALRNYDWPGNIRELTNVLETSIARAYEHTELYTTHLPEQLRITMLKESLGPKHGGMCHEPPAAYPAGTGTIMSYKEYRNHVLQQADRQYFAQLMEAADGDIEQACALSGLCKSRVYGQLKQCGIEKN